MKKISLITAGLLLTSSMSFAADSIESAFKEGKVEGSLNLYTVKQDNKGGNQDAAFTSGDVELTYETASVNGISGKVGFVAAHVFDEMNTDDSSDIANNAIMSEANLKYSNEDFSLTVGRQAIDLEWIGDYNEAVVANITAIENTDITLAYSDKIAVAGVDEVSERFEKINGKEGIYLIDVKYQGFDNVELNPYFYTAKDLGDLYGIKSSFNTESFGIVAHYAASNDDDSSVENGSIAHLELSTQLAGVNLVAGYVKTDKDGTGSIIDAGLGDNISPFEDGNHVYDADARTTYGLIGYEIAGISLGALYGETKYVSVKEKELNLMAEYSFTDTLSASALYADIKNDDSAEDYNKFLASISYTF